MKIIYFTLTILVFTACSSRKEVEFEKSSGKINSLKLGEKFFINLSEDHTKDGIWSIGNNHDKTSIDYINSVYHSNDGGSVDFNFETLKKGKTEINFNKSIALDTLERISFVIEVK